MSDSIRGSALLEWLIAVPVVLLLALGVLQWALIWQARHALEYAALRAAQVAATAHGEAASVRAGLADGLGPLWGEESAQLSLARIDEGEQAGWLVWRRIGPPPEVFTDFAEPARDAFGQPIPNLLEIPNDNLRFRGGEAGSASGLTLQQANQLTLQVRYGVPLVVPLVSTLIVRVMEVIDGCASAERLQVVVTDLDQAKAHGNGRAWACGFYRAPQQTGGDPVWRLPLQVAASARMQSALRVEGGNSEASKQAPIPPEQRAGADQPLTAPERGNSGDNDDRENFADWVDGHDPEGPHRPDDRDQPVNWPAHPGDSEEGICEES